jgi:hypothetical protein
MRVTFATTDPSNGTLSAITDQSCQSGSPNADTAVLTYTHDGSDTTSDSFTYQVCDDAASCATATVSITITPPQEPPTCPEPTVTVSPSSGSYGDEFRMQGEGWLPGGTVFFTIFDFPPFPAPVSDSGTWETNGPLGFEPPGNYEFVFSQNKDGCELRATALFTVNEPTISLDPTEGPPGTEVTVQGSDWVYGGQRIVSIQFAEPGNEVVQATVDTGGGELYDHVHCSS